MSDHLSSAIATILRVHRISLLRRTLPTLVPRPDYVKIREPDTVKGEFENASTASSWNKESGERNIRWIPSQRKDFEGREKRLLALSSDVTRPHHREVLSDWGIDTG